MFIGCYMLSVTKFTRISGTGIASTIAHHCAGRFDHREVALIIVEVALTIVQVALSIMIIAADHSPFLPLF